MPKPDVPFCPDFDPIRGDGYLKWSLPANHWSGAEYDEDTVVLLFDTATAEWSGTTELDQCIQRDLDDGQIIEVCREFKFSVVPAKFWSGRAAPEIPAAP